MSPPFARMGVFGGGSSNSFSQMPTGASPTTTSAANYPPMNVRASLNTSGYGNCSAITRGCGFVVALTCLLTRVYIEITDGAQSVAQFPPRAAEAAWPQWQGQQQPQSNAEQHPNAQGNQQDMFPVSHVHSVIPSLSVLTIIVFLFSLQQDVLSMLDQPGTFNDDDFEMPIYPQFNE